MKTDKKINALYYRNNGRKHGTMKIDNQGPKNRLTEEQEKKKQGCLVLISNLVLVNVVDASCT